MSSNYSISKKSNYNFEETLEKIIEALKSEGFGVLTEIDVKATLKKKINVEFNNYKILGACNPPFAHKALLVEEEIGLMLPCNIIVYENREKEIIVSAIKPSLAMQTIGNADLNSIATEIEKKLESVINKF